mgnify:CR=1 FL=1
MSKLPSEWIQDKAEEYIEKGWNVDRSNIVAILDWLDEHYTESPIEELKKQQAATDAFMFDALSRARFPSGMKLSNGTPKDEPISARNKK